MIVLLAFGTLRGGMQRHAFFSDARRMAHQIERFDQLVPGSMCWPPKLLGYERF